MGVGGKIAGRAVFLDRDGVLNRAIIRSGKPYPPSSLKELELAPGIEQVCRDLRAAGFWLIMVTNQPDVARGDQSRDVVEEINRNLSERLSLDDVRVCYHDDEDNCECRKPKPGLLVAAAGQANIDLGRSFMIGDRWKDIEAGRRAGCKTIFLDFGYDERKPEGPDYQTVSVEAAAAWILNSDT